MTMLLRNARLATMSPNRAGLGVIEDGAIMIDDRRIARVGDERSVPVCDGIVVVDCGGRWITPGLIDCHTHLVHAGNRAREFEVRLDGATFEEIARAGGGIVSSVRQVREASEADLVAESLPRLD